MGDQNHSHQQVGSHTGPFSWTRTSHCPLGPWAAWLPHGATYKVRASKSSERGAGQSLGSGPGVSSWSPGRPLDPQDPGTALCATPAGASTRQPAPQAGGGGDQDPGPRRRSPAPRLGLGGVGRPEVTVQGLRSSSEREMGRLNRLSVGPVKRAPGTEHTSTEVSFFLNRKLSDFIPCEI